MWYDLQVAKSPRQNNLMFPPHSNDFHPKFTQNLKNSVFQTHVMIPVFIFVHHLSQLFTGTKEKKDFLGGKIGLVIFFRGGVGRF